MSEMIVRILAVGILVGLVLAVYLLWARPYQLRWGATDEECRRLMPGDELHPNPTFLSTRAITIDATPEQIWPWMIQMGYNRAGFYGYDVFENIFSHRGIHSASRILPEFQHPKAGDEIPMSAMGGLKFHEVVPDRYMIWHDPNWGGFSWSLYPLDENRTRLVVRARWSHHFNRPRQLCFDLLTEFADHLAVRKALLGVKDRVEGQPESFFQDSVEFFLYLSSLLIYLGAILANLIVPLSWFSWLAGLITGAAWLIAWYAPISSSMENSEDMDDPVEIRMGISARAARQPLDSKPVVRISQIVLPHETNRSTIGMNG